jgi:hypothetical protein
MARNKQKRKELNTVEKDRHSCTMVRLYGQRIQGRYMRVDTGGQKPEQLQNKSCYIM